MNRFIVKTIAAVLLLVGIGGAVLWWKLDAVLDVIRPEITDRLSIALDRKVTLGAIRANLFPTLRIVANDISVEPELTAQELSGEVELSPLLRGEVRIRSIKLVQPKISLDTSKGVTPVAHSPQKVASEDNASVLSLLLSKLEISDGNISVRSVSGTKVLSHFSVLAMGAIAADSVSLNTLEVTGQEAQFGDISISSPTITFTPPTGRLDIGKGEFSVGNLSGSMKGDWIFNTSRGEIAINLKEASLPGLASQLAAFAPNLPSIMKSYRIVGAVTSSVVIRGREAGITVAGQGELTKGALNIFGTPIEDALCLFEVSSEGDAINIRVKDGSLKVGNKRERVTLSGTYRLPAAQGDFVVASQKLSYETIQTLLTPLLPKGLVISAATLKFNSKVRLGKSVSASADIDIVGVNGEYNGSRFDGFKGPLSIEYGPTSTLIRSAAIEGSVASTPISAKLNLKLPAISGDFSLKIPSIGMADALAVGGMASAPWAKNSQGMLGVDVTGELAGSVKKIAGTVRLKGIDLPAISPSLTGLSTTVQLTSSKEGYVFDAPDLVANYGGEQVSGKLKGQATTTDLDIESLTLTSAGGTAKINGAIELGGQERFKIKLDGMNFDAQRVASLVLGPEKISLQGTIKNIQGEVRGNRRESLLSSLSGPVSFRFTDGVLQGVNLGRMALEKVDKLPIIQGRLFDRLSPDLQKYLEGKDTVIREMSGSGELGNGGLDIRSVGMESDHYTIKGQGRYDFATGAAMKTQIAFSPGFSKAMQQQIYETKQLMDRNGILIFPLEISGVPPGLSVRPDIKNLAEHALSNVIEKQAGQLLQNILRPRQGEQQAP